MQHRKLVRPVNLQAALQPVRAERLERTARNFYLFIFLMVNFKVFSNSNPLKGLIMVNKKNTCTFTRRGGILAIQFAKENLSTIL